MFVISHSTRAAWTAKVFQQSDDLAVQHDLKMDIWPFVQSSHAHCIWRERKKREGKRAVRSICVLGGSRLSCLTLTALVGFQLLSFSLSLCPSCFISHYPSCDDFKYLRNDSLFKTFFFFFLRTNILIPFPLRLDLKVILPMWSSIRTSWIGEGCLMLAAMTAVQTVTLSQSWALSSGQI